MGIRELIPHIDEILGPLLRDPNSIAVDAFNGDGTVFKQDVKGGKAWDMNPAEGAVAAAEAFARKGHFPLLISARDMEDLDACPFARIGNIGLGSNSGVELKAFGGHEMEMERAKFGRLVDYVREECGTFSDVRYRDTGHGFGAQFWREGHEAAAAIKAAVERGLSEGRFEGPVGVAWKVVEVREGIYVVPVGARGKVEGILSYIAAIIMRRKRVELVIARGNSGSDAEMVRLAGILPNGIGFWVGDEPGMPKGRNVFKVRDEEQMARIMMELAEMLPDRSGQ